MCSIPVVLAQFFGAKRYGTHWGCIAVMVAVGNHFFSGIFAGIYDFGGEGCKGTKCVEGTFLICAGVNALSVVVAIMVYLKSR
jgi:hypothetical protein